MTDPNTELNTILKYSCPTIIIGMHRSGTSLLSRLFHDLGIHMGPWQSRDAEAVFFQRINRYIFAQANAHWAEPESILEAMNQPAFVQQMIAAVRSRLSNGIRPPLWRYFGSQKWLADIQDPDYFWGWKDPRTALVIPIWQQVFPNAKWVHIIRNGVDVAISLHERALRQQQKWLLKFYRFDFSDRTLDFSYCFHLWEVYLAFVERALNDIDASNLIQIHYEDLLKTPAVTLSKILDFLGYLAEKEKVLEACAQVDQSKLDNTSELNKYRNLIASLPPSRHMEKLGYLQQKV